MLNRQTIAARLGIAFGSTVLLLVAATAVGVHGLADLRDTAHSLGRDAALGHAATQVKGLALEARRFEKDIIINLADGDKRQSYKQRWDANRQTLAALLQQGSAQQADGPLHELYGNAGTALEEYAGGLGEVYRRIDAGELRDSAAANQAMGRFKEAIYRLEDAATSIDRLAGERLAQAEQQVSRSAANTAARCSACSASPPWPC